MRSTTLAVACAAVALAAARGQEPAERPPERPNALFALLDRFDPLDTRALPVVRVDTIRSGWALRRYGWLVARDGDRHEVRFLDLGRAVVVPDRDTRVLESSLAQVVAATLADLPRYSVFRRDLHFWLSPETPMHPQALAVVLARECSRRGEHARAEQLLEAAPQHRARLARALFERVTLDFADPRVPWTTLLERRRTLLAEFGTNGRFDGDAAVAQIEQVLAALADPATSRAKRLLIEDPWLDGNVKFDAAALVSPEPRPDDERRPLMQFLSRGLAVAPQLIELLDDPTATRSLHQSGRYGGYFGVNPVSDQAHAALEQLVGFSPVRSHVPAEREAEWRAWLEGADETDLRALHEARLEAMRPERVREYLRRWPDGLGEVFDRITDGPNAMPPVYLAAELARAPLHRHDERVRALVARCVAHQLPSDWRRHLAHGLAQGGWPEARAEVWRCWRELDVATLGRAELHGYDRARDLLRLLLTRFGDRETFAQLDGDLVHQPARSRLAQLLLLEPDLLVQAGLREPARAADRAAAIAVVGRLLVDQPEDEPPLTDPWAVMTDAGAVDLSGVHAVDAAAFALRALSPAEFPYEAVPDAERRHRQLAGLRARIAR